MAYCPNCGAKNRDDARFCESCGAALVAAAAPNAPAGPVAPSATQPAGKSLRTVNGLILVAAVIYAFTLPLGMMYAGVIGFFTALIALAVVLGLAYEPLRKGNIASAKTGLLLGAGLAVLYTVIDFALGSPVAAILNLVAAAALGGAWAMLK